MNIKRSKCYKDAKRRAVKKGQVVWEIFVCECPRGRKYKDAGCTLGDEDSKSPCAKCWADGLGLSLEKFYDLKSREHKKYKSDKVSS